MRIIVDGYLPSEWKEDLKERIKNKEIRTWMIVKDDGYDRLLHIGDEQYKDVVIRLVGPSNEEKKKGAKYTHFEPTVRENVKGKEEKEIAKSHFGIVLGRFAEVLNCHYADSVKKYQTVL